MQRHQRVKGTPRRGPGTSGSAGSARPCQATTRNETAPRVTDQPSGASRSESRPDAAAEQKTMESREGPTEDSRRALAEAKHPYMRIGFGARVGSAGGPPSSSSLHPLARGPLHLSRGHSRGERDQEHPLPPGPPPRQGDPRRAHHWRVPGRPFFGIAAGTSRRSPEGGPPTRAEGSSRAGAELVLKNHLPGAFYGTNLDSCEVHTILVSGNSTRVRPCDHDRRRVKYADVMDLDAVI